MRKEDHIVNRNGKAERLFLATRDAKRGAIASNYQERGLMFKSVPASKKFRKDGK